MLAGSGVATDRNHESASTELADYLLTHDRMKQRYEELGMRDQLRTVQELVAQHNTTIEPALASTSTSVTLPDYFLDNGLSGDELPSLRDRLMA